MSRIVEITSNLKPESDAFTVHGAADFVRITNMVDDRTIQMGWAEFEAIAEEAAAMKRILEAAKQN